MNLKLLLVASLVVTALPAAACDSRSMQDIQSSQIEENIPDGKDFEAFLQRDLKTYFQSQYPGDITITYEPLRNGPTQSGVAYPKFYLWVKVSSDQVLKTEGAVRIAAIDKVRFEVTDFLSSDAIKSSPESVGAIFPAALVPAIKMRAGVK